MLPVESFRKQFLNQPSVCAVKLERLATWYVIEMRRPTVVLPSCKYDVGKPWKENSVRFCPECLFVCLFFVFILASFYVFFLVYHLNNLTSYLQLSRRHCSSKLKVWTETPKLVFSSNCQYFTMLFILDKQKISATTLVAVRIQVALINAMNSIISTMLLGSSDFLVHDEPPGGAVCSILPDFIYVQRDKVGSCTGCCSLCCWCAQ